MEFFVEFDITIPAGTPVSEVESREKAEASATAALYDEGNLVRIWKLPRRPDGDPILGLYRADSLTELDGILRALPLYQWMHVVVTPLDRHPSDPGTVGPRGSAQPGSEATALEYLVTMTTHPPAGTTEQAVQEMRQREAVRSHELATRGHLLRLWRPPVREGEWRTLGLFSAQNPDELGEVLASMPLRVWRTDEVTPLAPHPNDPFMAHRGGNATKSSSRST